MDGRENETRAYLTQQQRHLLLAGPIARLSRERGVIFKDDPAIAEVDVQYLALSAVDFVMERSAIESGASPAGIVDHVAAEATRIMPILTEEQGRKVGQVILDYLANAREGHKAFRAEYYDVERGRFSFRDFRLLVLFSASDGSVRFKLGEGAQVLTLAMLDIPPEFAQEAEAIMIRKAVERGHFQDAHTLARRARMRSIHYQQFIDDRLFQVRRAADRVVWSREVLPQLDEARVHLGERRKYEAAIIESVRAHIPHARGDTHDHLVGIINTMEDCHVRHAALFRKVMTASEEFRQLQVRAFRADERPDIPDLEDRILVSLLSASMNVISDMSDEIGVVFAAPTPPRLYDLALLFASCTRPKFRHDPAATDEADDLVRLHRVPPEFDDAELQAAEDWLRGAISVRTRLDMKSAIRAADDQGLTESILRCVLFLMLRSWCPEDDPLGVIASIDGVIAHERATGDNLVLAKDASR